MENQDNIWDVSKGLDFLDTSSENATEEEVIDYLARIIVDIYNSEECKENLGSNTSTRG